MQGETAKIVNNAEEEKALGPGWFDSPAKAPDREAEQAEIRRGYRESFKAAVNNPAEQVRIHFEYKTLHPKVAAADDSWNSEVTPMIPALQNQAALERADARQVEDQERRAIEAEATEAPAANHKAKTGKAPQKAGRKTDDKITDRNKEIATLLASGKPLLEVAKILDAQRKYSVPGSWMIVEDDGTPYPVKNFEKAYYDPDLRKKLRGLAYDVGRARGRKVGLSD